MCVLLLSPFTDGETEAHGGPEPPSPAEPCPAKPQRPSSGACAPDPSPAGLRGCVTESYSQFTEWLFL